MRLLQHLAQLESAQLVRALPGLDLAYIFRHTLVQETAYGSLLVKSRREVHRQAALCYEQLHVGALEEHAALLAHHFGEAGDPERTLKYATMAGDEAFRLNASAEAIQYYAVALAIAVGARQSAEGTSLLIHLYTRRGRMLELSGHYEAALANYAEMTDLARERSDRALELAALIAHATARTALTPLQDLGLAGKLSERALEAAHELDDPVAEANILWNRSLMGYFMGRPGQAVADGEQAIAIARRLGLREQLAYALHDLQRSYIALGQIDRGRAALAEAQTLWRELDNIFKPVLTQETAYESLLRKRRAEIHRARADIAVLF